MNTPVYIFKIPYDQYNLPRAIFYIDYYASTDANVDL